MEQNPDNKSLMPTSEQITQAANVLAQLPTGQIPEEISREIERLWVTSIVRVVPLRQSEGKLQVLCSTSQDSTMPSIDIAQTWILPGDTENGLGGTIQRACHTMLGSNDTMPYKYLQSAFYEDENGAKNVATYCVDLTNIDTPAHSTWINFDDISSDNAIVDTIVPELKNAFIKDVQFDEVTQEGYMTTQGIASEQSDHETQMPTSEQITQAAKVLTQLQTGVVPLEIFHEITRLWVTSIVEVVPLRIVDGKVQVLLLQRPDDDPNWPSMKHTPGTVLRATDVTEGIPSAISRIYNKELGIEEWQEPQYVQPIFHQVNRGAEMAQVFYIDLTYQEVNGEWYDADALPKDIVDTQLSFIQAAVNKYTTDKQ
jgi:hypothetical protein